MWLELDKISISIYVLIQEVSNHVLEVQLWTGEHAGMTTFIIPY